MNSHSIDAVPVRLAGKLAILADAAKYDASCASSGAPRRDSRDGRGVGGSEGMGICHSYAPDGRCISLLKVLLTNFCTFDCLYCVNRVSSDVPRARFGIDELVELVLAFYWKNLPEASLIAPLVHAAGPRVATMVRAGTPAPSVPEERRRRRNSDA